MDHRTRQDDATSGGTQRVDTGSTAREPRDRDRDARGGVSDAGRTSGGGSLGHVQPDKVEREAPLRNNAEHRESDEPTLPSDDAALNTKI